MSLTSRIRAGRPIAAADVQPSIERAAGPVVAAQPVNVSLALHRDDFHLVGGRIVLREGVPLSPFTRAALRDELPGKEVNT